jgi:type I restriction enzyme S subunit
MIIPEKFHKGIINPRLIIMRCKDDILPEYLSLYLNTYLVGEQLNVFQQGGTMGVLSASTLAPLLIVKPKITDQKAFVESNLYFENYIKAYLLKLKKIQFLKKISINSIEN